MLWLQTNRQNSGMMNLGGSLTRQMEQDFAVNESTTPHLVNIGRMVEDVENKMRSSLNEIYFSKTCNVVNNLRSMQSQQESIVCRLTIPAFLHRRIHRIYITYCND
uniref:F-actin-capping protein subunit beta n=1 Tax=Romanomermis culicivorax TaxID=13658 RepID=A0A915JD44_ROMCU